MKEKKKKNKTKKNDTKKINMHVRLTKRTMISEIYSEMMCECVFKVQCRYDIAQIKKETRGTCKRIA